MGLVDSLITGVSTIPGIGTALGFAGGVLNSIYGGINRERMEDPITTEALKRLTAARDSITNVNPEANRRMTDQSLAVQQGAAVENALNASQSTLANQGVGGDIVAPNASAVANSTAAVGAAAGFAGARAQNNQGALQGELQRAQQLEQNAADYGAQAAHVNLVESQKKNFGGALLAGLYGAGSIAGIAKQIEKVTTDEEARISTEKKLAEQRAEEASSLLMASDPRTTGIVPPGEEPSIDWSAMEDPNSQPPDPTKQKTIVPPPVVPPPVVVPKQSEVTPDLIKGAEAAPDINQYIKDNIATPDSQVSITPIHINEFKKVPTVATTGVPKTAPITMHQLLQTNVDASPLKSLMYHYGLLPKPGLYPGMQPIK